FGDDRNFLGPLLTRSGNPHGLGLPLDDGRRHARNYDTKGTGQPCPQWGSCGGLATRRLRAQATGGRLFSCPTIEHSYAVTVLALSPDVGIRLQADVS